MMRRILQGGYIRSIMSLTGWARGWLIPAMLRRRTLGAAFAASLLAVIYWGLIASDRYVSIAHVVVQTTDVGSGQGVNIGGLLGNAGGNGSDQMLLRDHLLSENMLGKLDAKLDLRAHYSNWRRDPLSRMWFSDVPLESFYQHYLSRVGVEYDSYAGVLIIKAQAYDPKMALAITSIMVAEGERHMNAMAHNLANEQVSFLEKQVGEMGERVVQSRKALLNFQNKQGLVSPQGTAENIVAIINRLEGQLADLQTQRASLLGYLMPGSHNVVELNQQIAAIQKQIEREQGKLISTDGKMLNSAVEEYQRLQMDAEFTQDVYKTALNALEHGRVEALRTLKKVSIVRGPTLPEYPLEPRRLYNIVIFILITLLLAGITHLLAAIIRDHKD